MCCGSSSGRLAPWCRGKQGNEASCGWDRPRGSLSLCLLRVGEFSVGLNSINGNLHDGCGVHRRSTFLSTGSPDHRITGSPVHGSTGSRVHRFTGSPVPTKKSLAGQPLFPRLVINTVSSRLLDTVRQRYSVDACAPTFRVAAARLSHCEQAHLTDGIPEDYTSQLSACSHLPWHLSCQLFASRSRRSRRGQSHTKNRAKNTDINNRARTLLG